MKKIIIIGAGGNTKVIIDILLSRIKLGEELEIIGILDDDINKVSVKDYPVLGTVQSAVNYSIDKEVYFINGIGQNAVRKSLFKKYSNLQYYTAIHPSALIGSGVKIGLGSVIMPGAIINADYIIGKHVLINTGAIIEHDNIIKDFAHVAPGSATAGNVQIGETSMLGIGAKVIQGIKIGDNVMIGAGSVVIADIPDACTAVGIPAIVIKRNGERV
jgi:acetyltransferase EpsM